ncbi:hypothetical protein B0H13DRAFT_1856350 [Mycena leptocephala]|nr:hypothetical protein B0H13DRAFT_1856350 [Mycena leptocephala]
MAPTHYFSDREQKHKEFAARIRASGPAKRAAAAKKPKETGEKNKQAKAAREKAQIEETEDSEEPEDMEDNALKKWSPDIPGDVAKISIRISSDIPEGRPLKHPTKLGVYLAQPIRGPGHHSRNDPSRLENDFSNSGRKLVERTNNLLAKPLSTARRRQYSPELRTFLPRQIGTVVCLEQVHQEWRVESLAAWRARRYSDSKRNTLQQAIQVNARRRMLRDARIVSLLGQLISAWKTHLARGLASLASGPNPFSDERIMRECRVIADKYKTMEDILEATHNVAPGRLASDTPVGRVFSAVPSLGHVRDIISPVSQSEKPIKRRESARLKLQKSEPPAKGGPEKNSRWG